MSNPDRHPFETDGGTYPAPPAARSLAEEAADRIAATKGSPLNAYPADPSLRDAGPIAEALGYTRTALDNVEHQLGDLNAVLERLGYELRPVLTMDGEAIPEPMREARPDGPEATDRRSTVARRIVALGHRAEDLASTVVYLRNKAADLVGALELGGIDA